MNFWQWNLDLLALIARMRNPVLDYLIGALTWLGSEYIVIGVLSFIFLCGNKKLGYRLCLVFFISCAVVQTLKLGCRIERPWELAKKYPTEGYSYLDVLGSKAEATGFSFPSGHTVSSTALFGVLAVETKKKRLRALCIGVILVVAFSRLYLGVHTLLDVAVAAAVAGAVILAVQLFEKRPEVVRKELWLLPVITAAVSLFAMVFGWISYRDLTGIPGKDGAAQALDCIKMASCGLGFAIGYPVEKRYIRFDSRAKSAWIKAVRFLFGVAGVMVLKEGIKYAGRAVFGKELLIFDVIRYMMMILFVVCIYPVLIGWYRKRNHFKNAGKRERA